MSEWQMPQNLMSIRTSRGPIARRWISSAPSGASGAIVPTARAVVVFPIRASEVVCVSLMQTKLDTRRPVTGVLSTPLRASLVGVDRRGEIREFLVSRRAKIKPEETGLRIIDARPRRVPGLRREEVAQLAGVSTDYYTQLERGDLEGASDSVLNAIARALHLDDAERLHLYDLARPDTAALVPTSPGVIRPSVQRVLDAFTEGIALVRNRRWDYLAANALGRAVYAQIFDGGTGPPNHVRYVFLDERARSFFDDWQAVAHDTARILRSEAGGDPHDPGPTELIEELAETSAEFRAIWSQHDVRLPAAGLHRFHHPLVGELDLVFEAAELRADPGLTLLLATADEGSPIETALRRLAAMAETSDAG